MLDEGGFRLSARSASAVQSGTTRVEKQVHSLRAFAGGSVAPLRMTR